METTERVVESYMRYVKGCATIPNIRCAGQFEIDLLAINPMTLERYHVESGISIPGPYSKLTAKPYDSELFKERVSKSGQRRTVDYFVERKFDHPDVASRLAEYGFVDRNYARVIASWDWTPEAAELAAANGIELWRFPDLMLAITGKLGKTKGYFTDDTVRTLHLYALSMKERGQ